MTQGKEVSQKDREHIVADWDRGISIEVLAKDYGHREKTIRKILRRAHRTGPQGAKPEPAPVIELLEGQDAQNAAQRRQKAVILSENDALLEAICRIDQRIVLATDPKSTYGPADLKNLGYARATYREEMAKAHELAATLEPGGEEEHRPADFDAYPVPPNPDDETEGSTS